MIHRPNDDMPGLEVAEGDAAVSTDGEASLPVIPPAVEKGLCVTAHDGLVSVAPGVALIHGRRIHISNSVELSVEAPAVEEVREQVQLHPDPPQRWQSRTRLFGEVLGYKRAVPHALLPGSFRLLSNDGDTVYTLDRDYVFDEVWCAPALIPGGRIRAREACLAEYRLSPKALDAVVIDSEGAIRIVRGRPVLATPLPPDLPAGAIPLAHIYWPGGGERRLSHDSLFPVGAPFTPPAARPRMADRIPRTMAALKNGEAVTITCWGDSVTQGGDVEPPSERYSDVLERELRKRFPNVSVVNVSRGGSNSFHWLEPEKSGAVDRWGADHPRWAWVVDPGPDLVTIEFVNDAGLRQWSDFCARYDRILAQLDAAGAEVILMTPHFTMREMMGFVDVRAPESRPYVHHLRRFAAERNIALADASRRWEFLWREGLPYETLLGNGINHPDRRGHRIFVEELLRCFE